MACQPLNTKMLRIFVPDMGPPLTVLLGALKCQGTSDLPAWIGQATKKTLLPVCMGCLPSGFEDPSGNMTVDCFVFAHLLMQMPCWRPPKTLLLDTIDCDAKDLASAHPVQLLQLGAAVPKNPLVQLLFKENKHARNTTRFPWFYTVTDNAKLISMMMEHGPKLGKLQEWKAPHALVLSRQIHQLTENPSHPTTQRLCIEVLMVTGDTLIWAKKIATGNAIGDYIQVLALANTVVSTVGGGVIADCILSDNGSTNTRLQTRHLTDIQIESNNSPIDAKTWFIFALLVQGNKTTGDLIVETFPQPNPTTGEPEHTTLIQKSISFNNSFGGIISFKGKVEHTIIEGNHVGEPTETGDALIVTTLEDTRSASNFNGANTVIQGKVFEAGDVRIGRFADMIISGNHLDCFTESIIFEKYSLRYHIITGNKALQIVMDNFTGLGSKAIGCVVTSCNNTYSD